MKFISQAQIIRHFASVRSGIQASHQAAALRATTRYKREMERITANAKADLLETYRQERNAKIDG